MNTPDKEVLVVSDEDEQEYLTDEIVLHNERIEQILQRHDSCKAKWMNTWRDLPIQKMRSA